MFTSKILIACLVFVVIIIGLSLSSVSFSYSPFYTHPDLTEQMVKLYKSQKPENSISSQELKWLRDGAIREDEPPRWINHFYNPISKEGWTGKHFGTLSESEGYKSGADMSSKPAIASIDWATNQKYQSAYGRQYGNQTWQKAIRSYIDGDKKSAFLALGHILHLVGDLGVPAHTRNDSHPGIKGDPGSPYEDYTKSYTNSNSLQVAENLIKENRSIPGFNNVSDAFDYLANYSNANFFSEDTINNEEFVRPSFKQLFLKRKNNEVFLYSNGIYLAQIKKDQKTQSIHFTTDDQNFILPSYRKNLFPKVVLTGAGVINLFFEEVENYKNNPELLQTIIVNSNEPFSQFIKHSPKLVALKILDTSERAGVTTVKVVKKAVRKTKTAVVKTAVVVGNVVVKTAVATKNTAIKTAVTVKDGAVWTVEKTKAGIVGAVDAVKNAINPLGRNSRGLNPAPNILSLANVIQADLEKLTVPAKEPETVQPVLEVNVSTVETVADIVKPEILAEQLPSAPVGEREIVNDTTPTKEPTLLNIPTPKTVPPVVQFLSFGGGAPMVIGSSQQVRREAIPVKEESKEKTSSDTVPPDAPIITSPLDFSQPFTSPNIIFGGTTEASSTIFASLNSATTTADSRGVWSLPLSFNQGTTTFNFTASDNAGNVSSSTEVSLFVDSQAPAVELQIAGCSASGVCMSATTTLNISWSSSANDITYFTINTNGSLSTTTATSTSVIAPDNDDYSFSVYATDQAGNQSPISFKAVSVYTTPVIINEIAWMGTRASSADEWIELYNKTNRDIDLTDWVLYSETDMKPYIVFGQDSKTINAVIPAKGYYLIERTEDDTVSDIPADWMGSFGSGKGRGLVGNNYWSRGEVLVLSKASTTIDRTVLMSGFSRWPAGQTRSYRSMERYDPDVSGEDLSNWGTHIYRPIIATGKNADGNAINGTPKARNSVTYLINRGRNIYADFTLTKANSPYIVNKSRTQLVKNDATLTIEPGVVIKFYNDAGMQFLGNSKIIAQGTPEEPIVFTSFLDDEYGGDLNRDATSTLPHPGHWFGMQITSTNNGSILDNTIFRYGGQYYIGGGWGSSLGEANLKIGNTAAKITNSVFEYSRVYGLRLTNSSSTVSNNIFRYNNFNLRTVGTPSGMFVSGGSPTIDSNSFVSNRIGLHMSGSTGFVSSNTFTGSVREAISSGGIMGTFSNNSGSNNGTNGIVLSSYLVSKNSTTTLSANPLPYVLQRYGASTLASSTLVISPGVVFKSGGLFEVKGDLIINGENPDDIVFTSLYDDTIGGDTTNNGDKRAPTPGDFGGIRIADTGSLRAKGFTMRYGGDYPGYGSLEGGIRLNGASADISNALFENGYPHSLYAVSSENLTIADTVFKNHNYQPKNQRKKASLAVYNSTTTLSNVSFMDNYLGVVSNTVSRFFINAVEFLNNTATTSPSGLW